MPLELVTSGTNSLPAALTSLAPAAGDDPATGKRAIDPALGRGYIQVVDLGPLLKLMIHQYELRQAVRLRKLPAPTSADTLIFSFRHVFQPRPAQPGPASSAGPPARALPTVRVSSADMEFEESAPANATINAILIAADIALFSDLRPPHQTNEVIQTLLASRQPYVYEVFSSPAMQAVAAEIMAADAPPELQGYYLKLKAEELLYLFLAELLKREHAPLYPLNGTDAQRLYALRDQLLVDLRTVPNLPELARTAGMSESKMKRLFKQIFGTTIYTYYQTVRLQEAMRLLRDQHLSVSEVGYHLGFQNMSHFTRLFERHVGLKPKQYSKSTGIKPHAKALGGKG